MMGNKNCSAIFEILNPLLEQVLVLEAATGRRRPVRDFVAFEHSDLALLSWQTALPS